MTPEEWNEYIAKQEFAALMRRLGVGDAWMHRKPAEGSSS